MQAKEYLIGKMPESYILLNKSNLSLQYKTCNILSHLTALTCFKEACGKYQYTFK